MKLTKLQKMTPFRYYKIEIDGIDKSGKSTLIQYLNHMSNFRFDLTDRGYMTQRVYNDKFNRGYQYEDPSRNTIYVLLTVCKEEHDIRCKITHEPEINFDEDTDRFAKVFSELKRKHYKCLFYNTTLSSFYSVAKDIIDNIDKWELEKGVYND